MTSPGDKKGQCRGLCGHVMAAFDKCARCREKLIGSDNCVQDKPCAICESFTDVQKDSLSTPTYHIHKEKKTGVLVSPSDMTVIASVEDREPAFQSPPQSSAHPAVHALTQAGLSTATSFVTSEQLMEISDKWAEQFTRFEALLSRSQVFSTPKSAVKPLPSHTVVSDTPFIAPSAWPTGPVESPAEVEATHTKADNKHKKKSHNHAKMGKIKTLNMTRDRNGPSHCPLLDPPVNRNLLSHRYLLSHRLLSKTTPARSLVHRLRLHTVKHTWLLILKLWTCLVFPVWVLHLLTRLVQKLWIRTMLVPLPVHRNLCLRNKVQSMIYVLLVEQETSLSVKCPVQNMELLPQVVKTFHVQSSSIQKQTRNQTVFFPVVCPVLFANMQGQPQKKGVRPGHLKK